MSTENTQKHNEQKETPIRDGDARPDQNLQPDPKKKSSPLASEKGRVSKERGADVDKWEDFRDGRTE